MEGLHMDDNVRIAMAKWPNVPDCFGWLGLDSRGQWYMRDECVQLMGSFQSGVAGVKGSVLSHDKLIAFIQRNYERDALGRWYFQNGPQRVFVELESTPYIWRLSTQYEATAHTGQIAEVNQCLVDEDGRVYLNSNLGFGLVHSLDVRLVAEAIEHGKWTPQSCLASDLSSNYEFIVSPQSTS